MMKKTPPLLLTFLLVPLQAQAGQLETWLQEVVKNSPSLASRQLASDAAKEGATVQRAWDPPQVGIEFFQAPVAGFPNPFYRQQEVDWSVQQMIPFPGKRAAMARPEELRGEMLAMDKSARKLKLVRQFKSAYWDLWAIEERLRLDAQRIKTLDEIADIAKRQVESGMASQTDALRARSEQVALRVDSANLSRNRRSMQAMLRALMARTDELPLDSIEAPRLPEAASIGTGIDSSRPDIEGMKVSARMSQAMADAANRERWPDLMVRGMYKQMVGMDRDYWSLMVGLTIPVAPWSVSGTNATVRQRQLEARRDLFEAQAMRNMATSEVRTAASDLEAALSSIHTTDSLLIPQADLAWQSAASAYRYGKGDFLMLLDSYRMAQMAREERIMNVMKAMQAQANLDEALGRNDVNAETRTQGGER